MSVTLADFASVNNQAAATSSKLKKQAILAEHLRSLDNADLPLAIRYALGRNHPSIGPRNLNVGWALISNALLDLLRIQPKDFHAAVVTAGEVGEALCTLWRPDSTARSASLTLRDIDAVFSAIARTGNQQTKRSLLHDLFSRCSDPREATYLAKILFSDLRTGVQEGVLQAAVAHAFNVPLSAIHRGMLLTGDIEQVALRARHGNLNEAQFTLFHPIAFMLATPVETPDDAGKLMAGRTFFCEDKLDGIRAQVHKSGNRVAIYTRTMNAADESFPDIVAAISRIPGDFLLDGEIVPWCDGCVMPFAHMQRRLGRKALTPRIIRENPLAFIAFDLLYLNGRLRIDDPLHLRREALTSVASSIGSASADPPRSCQFMLTSPHLITTSDQISAAFADAKSRRNEGIVLKDPDSRYTPGRRGQAWLKLKNHLPTLDCVVTAAEYGHGKRRNVLSDYTFAVWSTEPSAPDATLVNIGKAYSGVTDEEIAQLTEIFLKSSLARHGRLHLVEPRMVLEIAYDQLQTSNRHASGYAMRFPRIKRIRWDKNPTDADRLTRVIDIYRADANTSRQLPAAEPAPEPTLFDGL